MTVPRHQKASILCGLFITHGANAFQLQKSTSHHMQKKGSISPSATTTIKYTTTSLFLAEDADKLLRDLDVDLAREVEEALLLANDVWEEAEDASEEEDDEEAEIAAIADALTSSPVPPKQQQPQPPEQINVVSPPKQEPSLFTSVINNQVELDDSSEAPLPPDGPPSLNAVSFGENLQQTVTDEIERLKNLLFGLNRDLESTESNVVEAESTADKLKKEITASQKQRKEVLREIESQFKKEKESLMEQLSNASGELTAIMDESTRNITAARDEASVAEKDLLNQMNEFKSLMKQLTDDTVGISMEKEQIMNSKQENIDRVKKEAADKLLKYKAELAEDGEEYRLYNSKLQKKANEAEKRVRDIYDGIKKIREDRISLQQQIQDVESESLEQIATLEKQIMQDDEEYTKYLLGERARIDKLISESKAKYAAILEKKKAKRESIEEDFEAVLAEKDAQGKAAIAEIESKAKVKLDKLEEDHAAERMAIHQEKVEAVSAVREEMLAQLQLEDEKLNAIHEEMQPKIDSVQSEIAEVKAAFEQELLERRKLADVEKNLFVKRMETVKSEMQDKINAQRKEIDNEQYEFLREHNLLVGASEEECRRAWMELATLKRKVGDAGAKRQELAVEVKRKTELIQVYESDRSSFRTSLRLSFKAARTKIGKGTRRVLRRNKETTDV
eukprot:scaffold16279_cov68-Cyclotella_meneghiniana.AAC.3